LKYFFDNSISGATLTGGYFGGVTGQAVVEYGYEMLK
jgi:hypothetical protein